MLPTETLAKLGRDLRFVGTFHVVYGALQCLSIIGAIVGIPYLLFGLRSRDAGEAFIRHAEMADEMTLADAHRHLADGMKMFKFACIAAIVLFVIGILIYGAAIAFFMSSGLMDLPANSY